MGEPGVDPGFFKGGGVVPWGCRINGACPQNVAIGELEPT